jgi:hypothetical protein
MSIPHRAKSVKRGISGVHLWTAYEAGIAPGNIGKGGGSGYGQTYDMMPGRFGLSC